MFSVVVLLCREQVQEGSFLIFPNPRGAGFPAHRFPQEAGGEAARGLQERTTRAVTLRTCRARLGPRRCLWKVRLWLGGVLIPPRLHLQMHRHQGKGEGGQD